MGRQREEEVGKVSFFIKDEAFILGIEGHSCVFVLPFIFKFELFRYWNVSHGVNVVTVNIYWLDRKSVV